MVWDYRSTQKSDDRIPGFAFDSPHRPDLAKSQRVLAIEVDRLRRMVIQGSQFPLEHN